MGCGKGKGGDVNGENGKMGKKELPFRPVAPEQACRASSMRMLPGFSLCKRFQATAAPVMPLPMMTVSADEGKSGVVRWLAMGSGGSCQ